MVDPSGETTISITQVDELEDWLSRPTPQLVSLMKQGRGDLIVLGAAGKMGPTLTRMARRAIDEAGVHRKVIAVSRFSHAAERDKLNGWDIETIAGDLLDEKFVASLPDASDVVFMAGMKFGATGNESLTWAMNTLLPANVCKRYPDSRIAAFSTGNIYGLVPVTSGGSVETDAPAPQGEYAMSCLGRERTFEYYSRTNGTNVAMLRLNYACELRYGVLIDLAQKIMQGQPVDLSMGVANVIWQGDANTMALLSLQDAASPVYHLNIAGPELLSIKRVCEQLAQRMDKPVTFTGDTSPNAILSSGQMGHRRYGYPSMPIDTLIDLAAAWVKTGGDTLGKPTKFEVRDGKF